MSTARTLIEASDTRPADPLPFVEMDFVTLKDGRVMRVISIDRPYVKIRTIDGDRWIPETSIEGKWE